ncbi:MAG: penicillin-binding protein 2 [Candidatus Andersenbacteria bacterium]|nr:penicillin-binding protein 2 [Candidatus Andersenbacteria bacterium]
MPSTTIPYNPQRRIWFLMVGSLVVFVIVTVRLADLQIIRHDYFTAVAENQRKRASELQPHRGTIYVSEGKNHELFPVASNTQGWIAYAVPRDMENPHEIAKGLAPALYGYRQRQIARTAETINRTGQDIVPPTPPNASPTPDITPEPTPVPAEEAQAAVEAELIKKFDQRTDPYEPLLKPYEILDEEFLHFLQEKKYPGIILEEHERRYYPEGSLLAHVLGYVGFDSERRIGRYGVEGFFNQPLEGDLGWLSAERDTKGSFIGVGQSEFTPAQDGADIELTIDRVVQSYIEQELEIGVKRYGAERGSVIVMDPKTGAILGMATYPTFDPNLYYAVKHAEVQTNPVVSDIFEPGSILKPIIMAAAMEEKLVKPNTTFVDNGPVKVDKYTINTFDGKHHGVQTMTQVLEQSNNIGMVWVGQQLGASRLYDFLRRFGLGERTGVELEGETQTNLPKPKDWNIATVATTSFGQGVAVTPLQALNATNVIANDGKLTQPHIISRITSPEGTETTDPVIIRQVVSENSADKVAAMMVSVIENGVAGLARVPGYYLAGKTGTAQVPDERGKYSENRKIISFVGFGPVEDPKFSILIKLDNPAGLSFASGTAAPMFRNISTKLLNYYQIPPSYDIAKRQSKFFVTN